ncbi:MFS transporter [Paraburkholderia sp. SIMBA_030]|uniref:MFS transporter n=1 Tax=Paraburkholderia sp. SIMBA_030 TaxID=3085773 RepID=UPI00397BB70E
MWLTFSTAIALLLAILGSLSSLQRNAIFSDLLRQRISVIAQTTAASFEPITDLGIPLSMIRNGSEIVARAREMDHEIARVDALSPDGDVIFSTRSTLRPLPPHVLQVMKLSRNNRWSTETSDEILSGFNIVGADDRVNGAVVVAYPIARLKAASISFIGDIVRTALLIWAAFSLIAFLLLRLILEAPDRAVLHIESLSRGEIVADNTSMTQAVPGLTFWRGLFGLEIEHLRSNLVEAKRKYDLACESLTSLSSVGPNVSSSPFHVDESQEARSQESVVASSSTRSLARRIASRLTLLAAVFIFASAMLLGNTILSAVNHSMEPELAARSNLIGTVVSENVQRAVAAGVPLEGLVGAERYFGDMLQQLPGVAHIAVVTGHVVLEAGKRIAPDLALRRERKDVRSHPIVVDGKEIAYVVIDIDPAFIARKFLDVFLDMAVIVLAAILLAFEIMVLMTSRALTAPLDRLQRIAAMQAVGNFSKRASVSTRNSVDRAARNLIERAEALNAQFATLQAAMAHSDRRRALLENLRERYFLSERGLTTLRFSYFTDLRLALFLFAAADELPLSFLPLYTRAADNPWKWVDGSVLISLPLAGYLSAIVFISPFAGPLAQRLGRRMLLFLSAIPVFVAHLLLYFATSVPEIVAARTIIGAGYALVTLACQDYVIDTTLREERDRSLGMFSTALFGGIFCGTALGGVLADRLGPSNVFLFSATLVATSAMLTLWFVKPLAGSRQADSLKPSKIAIFAALRDMHFASLVFGVAIPANVLLQAFICYLVTLSLSALGAPPADIGRTLMIYFIAVAVVSSFGGRVAERGVPVTLIAQAGSLVAGLSLLPVALGPGKISMIFAVLGAGFGHGLVRGAQVSVAMSIAETDLSRLGSSVVLAALRTMERLGSIVGLIAIAALAGEAGYAVATATVALWSIAGGVLFAIFTRPRPARIDRGTPTSQ